MSETPHSEFILSDVRDDWWNRDFLDLMAARLRLAEVRRVLDVGAGHGHWGQLLTRHVAPDATLLGVEQEEQWVAEATRRCERSGTSDRLRYRVGKAEDLGVDDASFDLVTCQTVLMHVADPKRALTEMKRALIPGGLLLLAEPDNLATLLTSDITQRQAGVDERLRLARFHMVVNEGRIRGGEGDHAIGSRLPQMVADLGFVDIQVHINDRASPAFTDYPTASHVEQYLKEKVKNIQDRVWLWDGVEARRLYLAGGGLESEYQADYGAFMAQAERFVQSVSSGTYSDAGGGQHYLISARRAA